MIRTLILAGTALALAAGLTSGAAASGRTHHIKHGRVAAVRGPQSPPPGRGGTGYDGAFIDLGPLGMTAACGANPRRPDYCGPRNGAPIDAWGR
jgi:hypothetical protein